MATDVKTGVIQHAASSSSSCSSSLPISSSGSDSGSDSGSGSGSGSGAPRAREARAWAEPNSLVNLPIPENLVITWSYTNLPPSVRPHHRTTNV